MFYHGAGLDYITEYGIDVYSTLFLIKKSFLIENEIRFSNHFFAEDELFMCRVLLSNPNIAAVSNEVYAYVQRNDAVTKKRDPIHLSQCVRSQLDVIVKIIQLAGKEDQIIQESVISSIRKNIIYWFFRRLMGSDIGYRECNMMIKILNNCNILPVSRSECSRLWFYLFANSLSNCPPLCRLYKVLFLAMR